MKDYLGEEAEGPDGKIYYKLCKYCLALLEMRRLT